MAIKRKACIVGSGVAGPALAILLVRLGFEVVVHEGRTEDDDGEGTFVNLAPNGLAILRDVGCFDEVSLAGSVTRRIVFLRSDGAELGTSDIETVMVRRAALGRVLRATAVRAGAEYVFESRFVGCVQSERSVLATFSSGRQEEAHILVGCDGIWSAVRRAVLGTSVEPRYSGVIDGGSVAPSSAGLVADGIMRLTFGRRAFFGYQPIPGGKVAWFQNSADWTGLANNTPSLVDDDTWRRQLLEAHQGDHEPIQTLIASTPGAPCRWPIWTLAPLPDWSRGRVVVIGDAAHAVGPHDGQGASLALQDASELARSLSATPDLVQAITSFTERRLPVVSTVAAQTARMGRVKFPRSEKERVARDKMLPMLLARGVEAVSRTKVDATMQNALN